jgi:hypothetical protein
MHQSRARGLLSASTPISMDPCLHALKICVTTVTSELDSSQANFARCLSTQKKRILCMGDKDITSYSTCAITVYVLTGSWGHMA